MNAKTEYIKKIQEFSKKSKNKVRKYLTPGCNNNAIKSHALQKNGILKQISEKNHIHQFSTVPLFEQEKKGEFQLTRTGINKAYTFIGFCPEHDTSIFNPIELKNFQIESENSIKLFSYRALCQEIRRKEISYDFAQKIMEINYDINTLIEIASFKIGLSEGIKNLNFFKNELEEDIKKSNNKFIHEICEIPRTEICISTPLNIHDENNSKSNPENTPYVTSFINLFPFKDKSYLMVSLNREFKCNWTEKLFNKLKNTKEPNHLKIISDLITTRAEFWCISPKLRNHLNNDKIEKMFDIWKQETFNFQSDIHTDFNLFD